MIRLIDTISPSAREVCLDDPAGVRLLCTFDAYRGYPFALFWEQVSAATADAPAALLCALDGCYTLTGLPSADWTELAAFLSALGAAEVFCTARAGQALGWTAHKPGLSLRLQGRAEGGPLPSGPDLPPGLRVCWNPSPGRIYETLALCRSDAIQLPAPAAFHADLSHRIRHAGGRCLLLERGEQALACAVAMETGEAAYVSGLSVRPAEQGKGLGAAALHLLCGRLRQEAKTVWTLAQRETAGFYEKLGFAPAGMSGWYRP
ncbi:MAG: GNAT family N-acetyltransferase [Clostridiales bacterium]|nr:GNAT family N-acetyltransferase [Clostridiales bacterium]